VRAVCVILARVNARVCVYDEIGKKIYSVVFERRRYALRGKKSTFTTFLKMIKEADLPVSNFLWCDEFCGRRQFFFLFLSPLSFLSLSCERFNKFTCVYSTCAYINLYTAFLLNCYKSTA